MNTNKLNSQFSVTGRKRIHEMMILGELLLYTGLGRKGVWSSKRGRGQARGGVVRQST